MGVLPHVRFLGYRSDVPDLMQAADVFVLPSHMEGALHGLDRCDAGPADNRDDHAAESPTSWAMTPGTSRWPGPCRDATCRPGLSILAGALLHPSTPRRDLAQRACRRAETIHFTADCMVEATLSSASFARDSAALQQPARSPTAYSRKPESEISNLKSDISI